MSIVNAIAYTIEEAAAATPLGKDRIRAAIESGDLVVHYHPDSNATLIVDDDLREYIRSLPTRKRSG